jgi:serine protease
MVPTGLVLTSTANIWGDNTYVDGEMYFWYQDMCKHGTRCAGTIAVDNDNNGVVGVAYETGIHNINVIHTSNFGWSYTSGLIGASSLCKAAVAKVIW